MKNGRFLAKKFNESFQRNTWKAVLTSLLKVFTAETETLWLNVRRSKKFFSKTLSRKCSPRLVEHNFDNPDDFFCLEIKSFRSMSEIDKHYKFPIGWIFPQKLHWRRKKLFWETCPKLFINRLTFSLSIYQVDEVILKFFIKAFFPKMFHWTLRMQFRPPW